MLALQDVLPQGVDPTKCELALTIVWILGFTMVLCWSILQVPDGGGTAAWVPDVVCRQRILMPLRPLVFALPSFFWPLTLVFLTAKNAETYCGLPLAGRRRRRGTRRQRRRARRVESHDVEEAYALLTREADSSSDDEGSFTSSSSSDDNYSFDEEGGIALSDLGMDLSDGCSPRPSLETSPPSPPTAMMEVPRGQGGMRTPGLFPLIPGYQPTPPASASPAVRK